MFFPEIQGPFLALSRLILTASGLMVYKWAASGGLGTDANLSLKPV
jgi:hypothetical protein